MLTKKITYDHNITEANTIQVRQITRVIEDGVEISKIYHRLVVCPGDDYSSQDNRTKQIANLLHTKDCIKKYRLSIKKTNNTEA